MGTNGEQTREDEEGGGGGRAVGIPKGQTAEPGPHPETFVKRPPIGETGWHAEVWSFPSVVSGQGNPCARPNARARAPPRATESDFPGKDELT